MQRLALAGKDFAFGLAKVRDFLFKSVLRGCLIRHA
jgi:hypothetical protein